MPLSLTVVNGVPQAEDVDTSHLSGRSTLVEIVCWEAAERMFGVRVWSGVASVWTDADPLELPRRALRDVAAAQARHRAQHGRWAGRLEELAEMRLPAAVSVTLTASADAWSASARHALVHWVCEAGGAGAARGAERDLPAPACTSEHRHFQ